MDVGLAHHGIMLRDRPHLLHPAQNVHCGIGAVVGTDQNVIKARGFIMRNPFEDIGASVFIADATAWVSSLISA